MLKNCVFALFILLLPSLAQAQSQKITPAYIDQLFSNKEPARQTYEEQIVSYTYIDSLSRSIDYNKGIFMGQLNLAYAKKDHNAQNTLGHIQILDSLYEIEHVQIDDSLTIHYYILKGNISKDLNDPLNALENYFIADSIAIASESELLMSIVNTNFANYYNVNGEYEKALAYNNKVICYYRDAEHTDFNRFYYLHSLINTSIVHEKIENYDSAIYYANTAIEGGYEKYNTPIIPIIVLGTAYLGKKDFATSKTYADSAQVLLGEATYTTNGFKIELLFGEINTEANDLDEAYSHLSFAREIADSMKHLRNAVRANEALFYWGLKKYNCPELGEYFENYTEIREQIFDEAVEKKEKQLLIKHETVKKEKKIASLDKAYQAVKTRNMYIIFSSIFILLIAIFIIYRNFARRKLLRQKLVNTILEKQVTRSKLGHSIINLKEKIAIINELKVQLSSFDTGSENLERITSLLDENYLDETRWNELIYNFDQINNDFSIRIKQKHTDITKSEIKLLILIKMGFINKEIAQIKLITIDGVKKAKQRLRKKLDVSDFSMINIL